MRFSSENNLELYRKDEDGVRENIFTPVDTKKKLMTIYKTTNVKARSNVSDKNNYEI